MAKKEKKAKADGKKRKGGRSGLMLILLVIVGLVVARFAAILLIVGIFPSVIAHMVDRSEKRVIFHTVFPCNLAGVIPFVGELMSHGNNMSGVEAKMFDLHVWLSMYISAGLGWVMILVLPRLIELFLSFTHEQKAELLSAKQKKLVEEWGPEVKRRDEASAS